MARPKPSRRSWSDAPDGGADDIVRGRRGGVAAPSGSGSAHRSVDHAGGGATVTRLDERRGTDLLVVPPLREATEAPGWTPGAPDRRSAPRREASGAWTGPAMVAAFDLFAVLLGMAVVDGFSIPSIGYATGTLLVLAVTTRWRLKMTLRALDAVPRMLPLLAVPVLLLAPLSAEAGLPPSSIRQALATPVFVVLARCLSFAMVRAARRRGLILEHVVIVGGGEVAGELARTLREHPEYGLDPIGHLDSGPATLEVPKLGGINDLDAVLRRQSVSRILVAFSTTREHELVEVLRTAVLHGLDVHVVPRFFDVAPGGSGADADEVWGIPLYRVRPLAMRQPGWHVKRAMDILVALTGIVLAAPALIGAAIAVRLDSPGPILFRQRRVGQFGREIDVLKFRTMRINEESETKWGSTGDPRMTRSGRFLRRTNLDELPQLWNILRGDMTLVGPRPERPYFVEQFGSSIPGYDARHRVPAGLTGWAQVHGLRGDTSIAERARFDNHYIDQWSLWKDLVVIVRTISAVFRKGST